MFYTYTRLNCNLLGKHVKLAKHHKSFQKHALFYERLFQFWFYSKKYKPNDDSTNSCDFLNAANVDVKETFHSSQEITCIIAAGTRIFWEQLLMPLVKVSYHNVPAMFSSLKVTWSTEVVRKSVDSPKVAPSYPSITDFINLRKELQYCL